MKSKRSLCYKFSIVSSSSMKFAITISEHPRQPQEQPGFIFLASESKRGMCANGKKGEKKAKIYCSKPFRSLCRSSNKAKKEPRIQLKEKIEAVPLINYWKEVFSSTVDFQMVCGILSSSVAHSWCSLSSPETATLILSALGSNSSFFPCRLWNELL